MSQPTKKNQPRIMLIDGYRLIPDTLLDQIQHTQCPIIRSVTRNQKKLQNLVQANHPPTLSIVSLPMAGRRDLALLTFLKHWLPKTFMVVITEDISFNKAVNTAGADITYCHQDTPRQQKRLIDQVLQHIDYIKKRGVNKKRVALLNERQQQILNHLAEGKSNKEISQAVYLSEGTVKNHITVIFNYLGVTNRTQAAVKVSRYPPD